MKPEVVPAILAMAYLIMLPWARTVDDAIVASDPTEIY